MILLEAREKTKRCARLVSKGLPVLIFPAVDLCFHARSKFLSLFVKVRSQFSPLSNSLLAPSRDVNLAQTHEIKNRKKLIDSFAAYAYSLLRSLNICPLTFGRRRKYSYAANELNFHTNLDHKHNLYQPLTIRRPNRKDIIARSRTITVIYLFCFEQYLVRGAQVNEGGLNGSSWSHFHSVSSRVLVLYFGYGTAGKSL